MCYKFNVNIILFILFLSVARQVWCRGGKAGKGAAGGATRYGARGNFNGRSYEMTWEGNYSQIIILRNQCICVCQWCESALDEAGKRERALPGGLPDMVTVALMTRLIR